jgi:hypothetical protein
MDGCNSPNKPFKRMSVEEYIIWEKAGHILGFGTKDGLFGVELCPIEEFDILYTEEQL